MSILATPGSPYMGLFSTDPQASSLDAFSTNVGQNPALVHIHFDWQAPDAQGSLSLKDFDDFQPEIDMSAVEFARSVAARDSVPAISWSPLRLDYSDPGFYDGTKKPAISLQQILDGEFDAYIRTVAQQVKELGFPVMMGLLEEVDQAAYFSYGADGATVLTQVQDSTGQFGDPAVADGPERVQAVYRYVIDLFRAEGATNVDWFMYMSSGFMNDPNEPGPAAFYPGDDYVDWVGKSLFVTDATQIDSQLNAGLNAWSAVTNKPFFIPELGVVGDDGNRAATWTALLEAVKNVDGLGAVALADSDSLSGTFDTPRIGSTPGEWDAIKNAGGFDYEVQVDVGAGPQRFSDLDIDTSPLPIVGTEGADFLAGTNGADTLTGLGGDDAFQINDPGDRVVETAGGGSDYVLTEVDYIVDPNVETVQVDVSTGLVVEGRADGFELLMGGAGADTLAGGGGGADTLVGGAGADALIGGPGDDVMIGEAGDDLFFGGSGVDYIDGGDGADMINANAGDDFVFLGGADTVSGGAGADTLVFTNVKGFIYVTDFNATEDVFMVEGVADTADDPLLDRAFAAQDGVYLEVDEAAERFVWFEGVTLSELTAANLFA